MDASLQHLIDRIPEELSSEDRALDALAAAQSVEPVPSPGAVEERLPGKGTTVGLHVLLSRAQHTAGRTGEADATLLAVAERLNQAGYWKALARLVAGPLDRVPRQCAPLIARARAHGGAEAVDDALLERAHHRLPGHGLLAWLTAEALMSRGDAAGARRIAARALPALIEEKDYDTADMALLLVVEEEDATTHAAMCRSLELLARQEAWGPFDNVLALAGDLLAAGPHAASSWSFIRELWRKHPDHEGLRPLAVRVARAHYAAFPEPERMLQIAELDRPSLSPAAILERARIAERYPPGYSVRHSGWGIGRIRDNDIESLVIDFPGKPLHRMALTTADQALEVLPPEDLRVLLATRGDEVARLAREDPAVLVLKAIQCLPGGRGTSEEIRKILVPDAVASTAWAAWWKQARARVQEDPRVDSREAYRNVFSVAGPGEDMEAIALPVWEPRKSPLKNLAVLDTFLSQHPGEAGRLLEAVRDRVIAVFRKHDRAPEHAAAAGLWLLRVDPDWTDGPEEFVDETFDMNALPKREQEQLLARLGTPDALIAALDSRLVGIRRTAWSALRESGSLGRALDRILPEAVRFPEAVLHALETAAPDEAGPRTRSLLIALLDLLENPPRESHRKRALALLAPDGPVARQLQQFPLRGEEGIPVASRLRLWQSSDRFRFPVLDLLRAAGHQAIAGEVEGARARLTARLGERMDGESGDPWEGAVLLTRPTLNRLRQERERVGMELKTTIPRAIQRARELGDLRENAEYEAARAKQASFARRFEELEELLDGVRLIEDLEREDGVVLPGTEVELEDPSGETWTVWILGEGDQEVGEHVVSYRAPVGKALVGLRVGAEAVLPREGGPRSYRIRKVVERLP